MSDQTPIKGWECPDCDHVCDVDEVATLTARCEALEAGLRVIGNLASHPETGDALVEALVRDTLTPPDVLPQNPNPNHK